MSNKPENFVPYFKIKYSRKSSWSLYEAASLSCGYNPSLKEHEVGAELTNVVSKRYMWLYNKSFKQALGPNLGESEEAIQIRHNTGSMLRALEDKFDCDKQLRKALDHMYKAPFGIDHTKFVTRSVYRETGRLIFEQYPKARIADVAKILVDLPKYYNNSSYGHISSLLNHQIEPYLKNLSKLKQKPSEDNIQIPQVDLKQLVEIM